MNFRDLEYIVALADTGRFVAAAARCGVSQPTLSTQVAKLETELGAALFERTRAGVILSGIGVEIVERARPILTAARELTERATAASGPLGGRLRLGVIPTAGAYLIPHLLPVLRRDYPGLETYIREDLTGPLLEQLRATELDAIIASPPLRLEGLDRERILVEEYLAALPPGHRLAREAEIRPADLAGERVLMLEEGHCMREQTLALCEWKAGVDVTAQATSIEGLRQMVSLGIGCTFLPRLATVEPFARVAPIVIRPLSAPQPTRTLILIWRRTHPRAGELRQLGRNLREGTDARSGVGTRAKGHVSLDSSLASMT